MPVIKAKPTSAGIRHASYLDYSELSSEKPLKKLTRPKKRISGRNNTGKITIRRRGGGNKRKYRIIDFKRRKTDIVATVARIEYDPNRGANIALLYYVDGEKKYILAPDTLKVGQKVISSASAEIEVGNAMKLKDIPIGTMIHNIELTPGKGGQLVRGAGTAATIHSKEGKYASVLLPSKEIRLISLDCYATIGQVSNQEKKNVKIGKAGRNRHLGKRPSVRGLAMHPAAHPHGGGEGRSGIGMKAPKTPWGKRTLGVKTRNKKKYSSKYIVKDRRQKKI
jgi:large subunit ribosomal protein L2